VVAEGGAADGCAGYAVLGAEEIQEGTAASEAFLEAIHPDTTEERKAFLRERMLEYCKFDTEAMVRLVRFLEGGPPGHA